LDSTGSILMAQASSFVSCAVFILTFRGDVRVAPPLLKAI
jgi:hypothetical protein